jgi:hypothetical protein
MKENDPNGKDAMLPEPVDVTLEVILDDEYPDDALDRGPPRASRLTLDEDEQGRRSLELLDQIFDGSADAEIERDGPIDQRGLRLTAFAHRTIDALEREMSDGRPVVVDQSQSDGQRIVLDEEADASPSTSAAADKIDTARIRRLQRDQLVRLVATLSAMRGESPPSCEGLSEEQLQDMARRLRVPAQA